MYFPVNIAKFLRTLILKSIYERGCFYQSIKVVWFIKKWIGKFSDRIIPKNLRDKQSSKVCSVLYTRHNIVNMNYDRQILP